MALLNQVAPSHFIDTSKENSRNKQVSSSESDLSADQAFEDWFSKELSDE